MGDAHPINTYLVPDDGTYPNNDRLPVLVYPQSVAITDPDPAAMIDILFTDNRWGGLWRDGIYSYHHYHSTAHEALGVFLGKATVQFGGADGPSRIVAAGDVVIIPAGVAHKCLEASIDFAVVGAYPEGQIPDMMTGAADERPDADRRIHQIPLPNADPVFGGGGPLFDYWQPDTP